LFGINIYAKERQLQSIYTMLWPIRQVWCNILALKPIIDMQ